MPGTSNVLASTQNIFSNSFEKARELNKLESNKKLCFLRT